MKIIDTCEYDQGIIELHEPRHIVFKRKDGEIEYDELDFYAYREPAVNVETITDERKIKQIGRKVNKIEIEEVSDYSDYWAEFTVIQRNPHTIDIIVEDFGGYGGWKIDAGDVLLRLKSY